MVKHSSENVTIANDTSNCLDGYQYYHLDTNSVLIVSTRFYRHVLRPAVISDCTAYRLMLLSRMVHHLENTSVFNFDHSLLLDTLQSSSLLPLRSHLPLDLAFFLFQFKHTFLAADMCQITLQVFHLQFFHSEGLVFSLPDSFPESVSESSSSDSSCSRSAAKRCRASS